MSSISPWLKPIQPLMMFSYASESPVSVWVLNEYTVRFDSMVGGRNCWLKPDFTPTFSGFKICYA
jgi:hypothetical protein